MDTALQISPSWNCYCPPKEHSFETQVVRKRTRFCDASIWGTSGMENCFKTILLFLICFFFLFLLFSSSSSFSSPPSPTSPSPPSPSPPPPPHPPSLPPSLPSPCPPPSPYSSLPLTLVSLCTSSILTCFNQVVCEISKTSVPAGVAFTYLVLKNWK